MMTEKEKIASRKRRDTLYSILYDKVIETLKNNPQYDLNDCMEASILLLVNSVKVVERKDPNMHIKVIDYLFQIFDDEDITLKDDEKKSH